MSSEDAVTEPLELAKTFPSFDTDDQALEALKQGCRAVADDTEFYEWMGLEVDCLEPGRAVLRLPFDESLTTPSPPARPSIHGGLVATLVDLAGVIALFAAEGEMLGMATADLSVDYHSSVNESVVADAVVVDTGGTLRTARVSVYPADADDPDPVATGRTTIRVNEG